MGTTLFAPLNGAARASHDPPSDPPTPSRHDQPYDRRDFTVGRTRFTERDRKAFDGGVILRAHRFRAKVAGYRLERGHTMDGEDDRADRWYVVARDVEPEEEAEHRAGGGYRSASEAADAAEMRGGFVPRSGGKRNRERR